MKPYAKLIIIYFFLLLGMFLLLRLLAVLLLNRHLDAPILVTGIVWIVLFSMIYWGVHIRELKPRLDYVQWPGTEPPDFEVTVTRELKVSSDNFSFQKFHGKLARRYEVTYINEQQNVIKLRDRFSMSSWGACTYIHYDKEQSKILVVSYPMLSRTTRQSGEGRKQNVAIVRLVLARS
jgi:hypothetical protein